MSEKEFETMKNAATTLDTNMTEKAFRKELQRIMETMNAVKLRASSISNQTAQTPTP